MVDIPNSFIQTRVKHKKDTAITNITGLLVGILLEIAPDIYEAYVTTCRKRVKQIVIQCQNAICITMMASLLYYHKFRKRLDLEGYEFNPYGPCVINNIINNNQTTICFHVNDYKLSQKISGWKNN